MEMMIMESIQKIDTSIGQHSLFATLGLLDLAEKASMNGKEAKP
jgi:hypothetical protein